MMKLHGIAFSNFFSMAKHALLEKGLETEFLDTMPSQDPAFLEKSPMGKVPMLETDEGCLTEASVIMEFLEEKYPEPALLPGDAYARACARRFMKTFELYVEGPLHPLVGKLFGREIPQHVLDNGRSLGGRGLAAIKRMAKFSPWICGEQFTAADIMAFYSLRLVRPLAQDAYDWDIFDEVPGMAGWYAHMASRPVTQRVEADMEAAMQAFMAARKAGG